jgi:rare lipoprotein A
MTQNDLTNIGESLGGIARFEPRPNRCAIDASALGEARRRPSTSVAVNPLCQNPSKSLHGYETVASLGRILILGFLLVAAGCSTVQPGKNGDWVGFTESGTASFYADNLQGRMTANGELYEHDLKTAAHQKMPFGSIVKVTNTSNGKSVVVTINDRGPFAQGRIIDLSKSAFSAIGDTSSGLVDVTIEVIR